MVDRKLLSQVVVKTCGAGNIFAWQHEGYVSTKVQLMELAYSIETSRGNSRQKLMIDILPSRIRLFLMGLIVFFFGTWRHHN